MNIPSLRHWIRSGTCQVADVRHVLFSVTLMTGFCLYITHRRLRSWCVLKLHMALELVCYLSCLPEDPVHAGTPADNAWHL